MPSSKSTSKTGSAGSAQRKRKRPHKKPHEKPPKPPKPPDPTDDDEGITAEPPIVVTSGSVEIELDSSVFPADPANPNRHKNANRRLTTLEIQDLAATPTSLMMLDLRGMAGGRLKIIIRYER